MPPCFTSGAGHRILSDMRIVLSSIILCAAIIPGCSQRSALPKLYAVPAANLVASSGRDFNLSSLREKVVIYDFIFTRCGGTCPLMTMSMKRLTRQIDPQLPVRFVTITVDPTHDSPAVLQEFARRQGGDPRWLFLTGNPAGVTELSVKGFKLAAGPGGGPGSEVLIHSSKLVLADRSGTIRGYYDGTDPLAVEKLNADIRDLARERV